ncbi:radical SAM protein [Saccharicrinis fermentans]|uniref:radical SAM protein n=1 Tax=Saccharicrinis fermentans TaxID=982 RepID=UPI0006932C76
MIDYPGNISAVIFTCGCNFSCNYCHNPQLIDSDLKDHSNELSEEVILEWISQNSKMLDAVVVTGGEPTLHSMLPSFIQKIKQLRIKAKMPADLNLFLRLPLG